MLHVWGEDQANVSVGHFCELGVETVCTGTFCYFSEITPKLKSNLLKSYVLGRPF